MAHTTGDYAGKRYKGHHDLPRNWFMPREENPKKWIAGAIKHPGALHASLGVPKGETIPARRLAAAAKAGGKTGKRARLALTLRRLHQG